VTVLYLDSDKAPCACIADGIMLATVASPGQRTLQIAAEKAPPGALAVITVRHKKTGEAVQYTVAGSWLPKLSEWNKTLDAKGRYNEAMKAEGLFAVTPVK
jgi:FmdE protein associated with molybdenum formylmethanofuran dehydrogenase